MSPFLHFLLLAKSIETQRNFIFLQPDPNLKVTWHFMLFRYLQSKSITHNSQNHKSHDKLSFIALIALSLLVASIRISVEDYRLSRTDLYHLLGYSVTGRTIVGWKLVYLVVSSRRMLTNTLIINYCTPSGVDQVDHCHDPHHDQDPSHGDLRGRPIMFTGDYFTFQVTRVRCLVFRCNIPLHI